MVFSACIEWLFAQEHSAFPDRIRAAKAMGIEAVEFHLWRGKPLGEIAETLDRTGVRLSSFCVDPRRSLVDPAQHDEFLGAVAESLEAAHALGSPPLIVASGFERADVSREAQTQAAIDVLRRAAALAAQTGSIILLEPLNTRIDHPGMFLASTVEALDIIEAVGSDHLRLLYDVYHSAVMGEEPDQVIGDRVGLVGHVQIADMPGRNEPGTGTIDWPRMLGTLGDLGYHGMIGLEYRPTMSARDSIACVRSATGL